MVVVLCHARPVPRIPTKVPRRLTEETVRGDAAAVPLVTYDFLDVKIGPQVRIYRGSIMVLLHPIIVLAGILEGQQYDATQSSDWVHHTSWVSYDTQKKKTRCSKCEVIADA